MKIFPLALTQHNWKPLIEVCQNVLKFSPTRGADQDGLDIRDPGTFLGSLAFDNQPLEALRNLGGFGQHVHASFVAELDLDLVMLLSDTDLRVLSVEGKKTYVTIVTGDMLTWKHNILRGCRIDSDSDFRLFMNKVLDILEQTNLREIFDSYVRVGQTDGTFVLQATN